MSNIISKVITYVFIIIMQYETYKPNLLHVHRLKYQFDQNNQNSILKINITYGKYFANFNVKYKIFKHRALTTENNTKMLSLYLTTKIVRLLNYNKFSLKIPNIFNVLYDKNTNKHKYVLNINKTKSIKSFKMKILSFKNLKYVDMSNCHISNYNWLVLPRTVKRIYIFSPDGNPNKLFPIKRFNGLLDMVHTEGLQPPYKIKCKKLSLVVRDINNLMYLNNKFDKLRIHLSSDFIRSKNHQEFKKLNKTQLPIYVNTLTLDLCYSYCNDILIKTIIHLLRIKCDNLKLIWYVNFDKQITTKLRDALHEIINKKKEKFTLKTKDLIINKNYNVQNIIINSSSPNLKRIIDLNLLKSDANYKLAINATYIFIGEMPKNTTFNIYSYYLKKYLWEKNEINIYIDNINVNIKFCTDKLIKIKFYCCIAHLFEYLKTRRDFDVFMWRDHNNSEYFKNNNETNLVMCSLNLDKTYFE